jgi:hypothetical protein
MFHIDARDKPDDVSVVFLQITIHIRVSNVFIGKTTSFNESLNEFASNM